MTKKEKEAFAKVQTEYAEAFSKLTQLEDRLQTMSERAADTRDNIVHMRERIRELREQRKYLSAKLEEAAEQRELDEARRLAYIEGMLRVHESTITAILTHRNSPVTVSIQEPAPAEQVNETRDPT